MPTHTRVSFLCDNLDELCNRQGLRHTQGNQLVQIRTATSYSWSPLRNSISLLISDIVLRNMGGNSYSSSVQATDSLPVNVAAIAGARDCLAMRGCTDLHCTAETNHCTGTAWKRSRTVQTVAEEPRKLAHSCQGRGLRRSSFRDRTRNNPGIEHRRYSPRPRIPAGP